MTEDTSLREKALRATKLHFRLNALIRDAFFHGRGRGNLALLSEADQAAWMDYDVSEYEQYKSIVAAFHASEAKDRRIEALGAENAELKKQLADERKPEFFWDYEDPENTYDTPDEAVEYADMGSVVRLFTGKSLPQIWATTRVLTVDERGDWDEHEVAVFDNEADAKRCWPESLEAARAALSGKEGQS